MGGGIAAGAKRSADRASPMKMQMISPAVRRVGVQAPLWRLTDTGRDLCPPIVSRWENGPTCGRSPAG